jgi:hypothetical protein
VQGPIVELMQNSNQLPFGALPWRELWSIPDPQRPDEGVTVFPRDPPVFVAVVPIDTGLIQCSLPQRRTRSEIAKAAS